MGVLGSVMPKFKVDPYAKKYIKKLEELGANTYKMCGRAIFPCAEIIANEIEKEIQKLPTAINEHGSSTNMINTITPIQKYGLMHGMGISHMQLKSGGTLDVKLHEVCCMALLSDGRMTMKAEQSEELEKKHLNLCKKR